MPFDQEASQRTGMPHNYRASYPPDQGALQAGLAQLKGKVAHARSMELLVECVKESVKIGSIQQDILSLNDTFRSVIKNGGDWADKGLR